LSSQVDDFNLIGIDLGRHCEESEAGVLMLGVGGGRDLLSLSKVVKLEKRQSQIEYPHLCLGFVTGKFSKVGRTSPPPPARSYCLSSTTTVPFTTTTISIIDSQHHEVRSITLY